MRELQLLQEEHLEDLRAGGKVTGAQFLQPKIDVGQVVNGLVTVAVDSNTSASKEYDASGEVRQSLPVEPVTIVYKVDLSQRKIVRGEFR